jgi:hypothetical protein
MRGSFRERWTDSAYSFPRISVQPRTHLSSDEVFLDHLDQVVGLSAEHRAR